MSIVLSEHLQMLATAPGGIQKLRALILELAVRGKLVPQDPNDEPMSEVFERITQERTPPEAKGICKKMRRLPPVPREEWPFEIPESWEWVRFDDVLDFQGGGQPPKSHFSDVQHPGFVQLIQIRDLGEKPQPVFIKRENASKFCTSADIMVGRYGASVGKVFWGKEGAYNVALVKMIDLHNLYAPSYLYQLLKSPLGQSYFCGISRSAQDGFNKADLENRLVPLLPIAEQHRIAAKVDELMTLCDRLDAEQADAVAARTKLIDTLLSTLTQSADITDLAANWQRLVKYFDALFTTESSIDALKQTILKLAVMGKLVPQDPSDEPASELLKRIEKERAQLVIGGAFKKLKALPANEEQQHFDVPNGWVPVRLTQLGEFRGGKTPSTSRSEYWDGSIPWVSPKDMKSLVVSQTEDYVSDLAISDGLSIIPTSSILIVVRSGILRRTVPVAINSLQCTVNQDLKALCLVLPDMARYIQLLIQGFEQVILETLTKVGTTVESIKFDEFSQHLFPLPPLAEQHRIMAKVEELIAFCDNLKADLAESRNRQAQLASTLIESALEAA